MADEDEVDILGEFGDEAYLPASGTGTFDEMAAAAATMNELLPYLGSNSWLLNTDQVLCAESSSRPVARAVAVANADADDKKCRHPFDPASLSSALPNSNGQTRKPAAGISRRKTTWTELEKRLFQKGMDLHGNSWAQVAKHVGTRTPLQVKNYARRYLVQTKNAAETNFSTSSATHPDRESIGNKQECDAISRQQQQQQQHHLKNEDGETKDSSPPPPDAIRLTKQSDSSDESEDVDIEDIVDDPIAANGFRNSMADDRRSSANGDTNVSRSDRIGVAPAKKDTERDDNDDDDNDRVAVERQMGDDYSSETTDMEEERIFTFAKPTAETKLERDVILDEEKQVHREFFDGRPQKTPERYLKIRNYILDAWTRSRPSYLNKTSVRPGLKNCGDVNSIGRIHAYLEQTGAINFGCEQTVYNRPLIFVGKVSNHVRSRKKPAEKIAVTDKIFRTDAIRQRKRRPPVLAFDSAAGGYTIRHDEHGHVVVDDDIADRRPMNKAQSNAKRCRNSSSSKPIVGAAAAAANPFRLIQCSEYSFDEAPFKVCVDLKALVVMDIHAHLSRLEVIGLLGGRYDGGGGNGDAVLYVTVAEPCDSLNSTGSECEMDPVSQTQASERLQQSGLGVVGWYHSHPTFAPNPSLRDLDTQSKFQHWFGRGGSPFLGVIVSPHHSMSSSSAASTVRYMIVGDEFVQPDNYRKPYRFSPSFAPFGHDLLAFVPHVERLIAKWMPPPPSITFATSDASSQSMLPTINKLISSVHHHLTTTQADQSNVLPFLCAVVNTIVSRMPAATAAHASSAAADQDVDQADETFEGQASATAETVTPSDAQL